MSWRIIVASSDEAQRAELKKGADAIADKIKAAGDAAEVHEVTTVADVRRTLRGADKDLVIATAALSERATAPGIQNQAGLELIKAIQAQPYASALHPRLRSSRASEFDQSDAEVPGSAGRRGHRLHSRLCDICKGSRRLGWRR